MIKSHIQKRQAALARNCRALCIADRLIPRITDRTAMIEEAFKIKVLKGTV